MSNSNHYPLAIKSKTSQHGERGYPWLFFYHRRPWRIGLIVTIIVIGLCSAFYYWYSQSGYDTSPASGAGLTYALIGTLFFILAAMLYSLRRRSRKRVLGELNVALNWHVFFALMGLATLFMHSFGHFEAISGTYALIGTVILTLSGLVGRMLDQFVPRLIARNVDKALTSQGDDRIETVSQKLEALMPGTSEHISELRSIHIAMQCEQLYRYIIRYWRVIHILLAFITIGLVIWHIIFALHLMLPGLLP
ncbi:MAG: hypothetical protein ACJ788_23050 [Ktedonobacteraceae bacterium]